MEMKIAEEKQPMGHATDTSAALDPVCGMTVDVTANKPFHTHNGLAFHFCSQKCHDKFVADPDRYIRGARPKAEEALPTGTIYTCPMHPEIEQVGPGVCPICAMALEPKGVPAQDEGPNPELVDFRRRFSSWW